MPNRIAFVIENPLDARDYARFGIDTMLGRGIAVDVLDVTAITRPGYHPGVAAHPDTSRIEHTVFGGRAEMPELMRRLKAADLIILIAGFTGLGGNMAVYRAIGRSKTPYLVISVNSYPGLNHFIGEPENRGKRVMEIFKRLMDGQINPIRSIVTRLPPRWLGVAAPAWLVLSGEMSDLGANLYPVDKTTRRIYAHSLDWETFAAIRANPPAPQAIAVFIDENVGFQRDLVVLGCAQPVDADEYYPRLRAVFDRIESELGLSVVVAANPRSGDRGDAFGHHRVEKGNTARLVASAQLVLAHRSTAIGYAAMFGKPLILMAMERQYRNWINMAALDAYSKELELPIQRFDDPAAVDLTVPLAVDYQRYARFLRRFIKRPDSPDAPFWDIVLDAVAKG